MRVLFVIGIFLYAIDLFGAWEMEVLQHLEDRDCHSVKFLSSNGQTIVGSAGYERCGGNYCSEPFSEQAVIWDENHEPHVLTLPGDIFSEARSLSADGALVIGRSCADCDTDCRTVLWEKGEQIKHEALLGHGQTFNHPSYKSKNGKMLLLESYIDNEPDYLWVHGQGFIELGERWENLEIAQDGTAAAWNSCGSAGCQYVRWDSKHGLVPLDIEEVFYVRAIETISWDGSVLVLEGCDRYLGCGWYVWSEMAGFQRMPPELQDDQQPQILKNNMVVSGRLVGTTIKGFVWNRETGDIRWAPEETWPKMAENGSVHFLTEFTGVFSVHALHWLPDGGTTPTGIVGDYVWGTPFVSPDGTFIAGNNTEGPILYTIESELIGLNLPGDSGGAQPRISGDSQLVAASSCNVDGCRATAWSEENGLEILDGAPGAVVSEPRVLSFNGSVIAGISEISDSLYRIEAIVWTQIADTDGDGIWDQADVCKGTEVPEGAPTKELKDNRYALLGEKDEQGDYIFTSTSKVRYDIKDTKGCSCEQIVEQLGLNRMQIQFGCTKNALRTWSKLVQ